MKRQVGELPKPINENELHLYKEILRVWAGDKQYFSIDRTFWDDPAAWGLLLVDLAKHVANAYKDESRSTDDILKRIKEGFDAEWEASTDN